MVPRHLSSRISSHKRGCLSPPLLFFLAHKSFLDTNTHKPRLSFLIYSGAAEVNKVLKFCRMFLFSFNTLYHYWLLSTLVFNLGQWIVSWWVSLLTFLGLPRSICWLNVWLCARVCICLDLLFFSQWLRSTSLISILFYWSLLYLTIILSWLFVLRFIILYFIFLPRLSVYSCLIMIKLFYIDIF